MKIRKIFKRIVFASLMVLLAVAAIPYQSPVKAADEYPDEVYFPIQVLDFREDNLLFQWNQEAYYLELYQNYYGLGSGKGLVENKLGDNGLPVYKKDTLNYIAQGVMRVLSSGSGNVLNAKNADNTWHDLSMRKYIQGNNTTRPDVTVLNLGTNNSVTDSTIWMPEEPGVTFSLNKVSDQSATKYYGSSTVGYSNIYAEVYANYPDGTTSATPVYLLCGDGIVMLANTSVSKTFTGLKGSYTVDDSLWRGDGMDDYTGKIKILVNDIPIVKGSVIRPDSKGEIKVTIQVDSSVPDALLEEYNQLAVGSIVLKPYINSTDGNKGYPIGTYEQSKLKYDSNPDLGFTHITTCFDYAYFVTSNFFQYNPSLNVQYNEYENLIFHRVDEKDSNGNKKTYYEFAADSQHTALKDKLVYNKNNKTIRNRLDVPAAPANPALGLEAEVEKNAGSMFVADDVGKLGLRQYPDVDKDMSGHNFHFTISSHSKFVYKEGQHQLFYFSGDDDVYVFINGYLYVDLGGAHSQINSNWIDLETLASKPEYQIEKDKPVTLDFFYMERHTSASNFYGKMNFLLASDDVTFDFDKDSIPYGYMVDLNYNFTTLRELTTNKNIVFSDNLGNEIGAKGLTLGDGVTLKKRYKKNPDGTTDYSTYEYVLSITVTKDDGMTKDDSLSKEFKFERSVADTGPFKPTDAESKEVADYFAGLGVRQGIVVKIDGLQYDTSTKPYQMYTDVGGESVNEKCLIFSPKVDYEAWMDGAKMSTPGKVEKNKSVTVVIGSLKLRTADVDNEKKELADYGAFTIDRDEYKTDDPAILSDYNSVYEVVPGTQSANYSFTYNPDKYTYIDADGNERKKNAGVFYYKNDPSVTGIREVTLEQIPRGRYTITLDPSVLTSYKVFINNKEVPMTPYDPNKDREDCVNKEIWINEKGIPEYTFDFEPEYDFENKVWVYPDNIIELRAKRKAPDLKDLT